MENLVFCVAPVLSSMLERFMAEIGDFKIAFDEFANCAMKSRDKEIAVYSSTFCMPLDNHLIFLREGWRIVTVPKNSSFVSFLETLDAGIPFDDLYNLFGTSKPPTETFHVYFNLNFIHGSNLPDSLKKVSRWNFRALIGDDFVLTVFNKGYGRLPGYVGPIMLDDPDRDLFAVEISGNTQAFNKLIISQKTLPAFIKFNPVVPDA